MKLLAPAISVSLSDAFVAGNEEAHVEGLVSETGRELATEDLSELVVEATRRFSGKPAESDHWLGPRLHAVLRLSRREASQREMWLHLGIVDCPEYVRWRFPGQRNRFLGGATIHAFSRLWWSTELFRRGADYGSAIEALHLQEVPNTILRLQATRNQPFCVALLTFLATRRSDGQRLIGRQINRLVSAVNSQFFVAALDAVAPSAGLDGDARRAWSERPVPVEDLLDEAPIGPDDLVDPNFEAKVDSALNLLHRVADSAGIATKDEPRAGSKRPGDIVIVEEPSVDEVDE